MAYKELDLNTKTMTEKGTDLEEMNKKMDERYINVKKALREKDLGKIQFTQTHLKVLGEEFVMQWVIFYGKEVNK